ncbi:MAG: hypothetical protein Q8Q02_16055 [Nocardioides sp.]|nr:hypothetical protein [Nocardioides sp.]
MTTDPTPGTPPPARRVGVRPVLAVVVGIAVSVLVAAGLRAWGSGEPAAASVALGLLVVLAFYGIGTLFLAAVVRVMPGASLALGMLTYSFQVLALGAFFIALARSEMLDGRVDATWLGGTIAVGTLAWVVAHVRWATTRRQLAYDLPPGQQEAGAR